MMGRGWILMGLQLLLVVGCGGNTGDDASSSNSTDTPAPQCTCNTTTPAPTCTLADVEAGTPCSLFCQKTGQRPGFTTAKSSDTTGIIVCITVTTTASTTTVKGGGGVDDNGTTVKNNTIITPSRCETGVLSGTKLLIAKIFSYLSFIWILICVLATIVVNFKHKNTGHHRWLHMFQEIFIIILWLFMGIFNLTFKTSATICKATSIVIHISVVVVSAALVFEAIFADSMIHNKSFINGRIPPVVNYIAPAIIGLIPALVTYFIEKNSYLTGIHCFAEVPFDMFWGFVIPVWILLYVAGLKSSLGNLACDLTDEDIQDEDQIFWAKKSCKSLFFFSFNLLACYLLCLFGSSQQRFIIFILFFLNSLLFGPIIFITHTYCHRNSQRKLHGKGMIGGFYKPCPPKHVCPKLPLPPPPASPPLKKKKEKKKAPPPESEPVPTPEEKKPEPEKPKTPPLPVKPSTPPPPKTDQPPHVPPFATAASPRAATPAPPPVPPRRPSTAPSPSNWPNSREFYGWVGGKKKYEASQDALFMPKPS